METSTHNANWKERLLLTLSGINAQGYYCSALIHFCGFGVLLLVLWSLDALLIIEVFSQRSAVEAALSDEEILDTVPKFDAVAEIEIEDTGGADNFEQLSSVAAFSPLGADFIPNDIASPAGEGEGVGDLVGDHVGFKYSRPEDGSAVTKGSFTAWTVPQRPVEGQPYRIIIQVRLPRRVVKYRSTDLSGTVTGTDFYKQTIPFDARKRNATYSAVGDELVFVTRRGIDLPIRDRISQIVVRVPGAQQLVRDTIVIRSRRLKEEQRLELQFAPPEENLQLGSGATNAG